MHVSLDSALGRQRRLNQVGESITQIAPDPAAAYSLRSLTGSDPRVVRVRRDTGGAAGDNDEEDFTVSGINSGALVDFVGAGNDGFVETWYDQSGNGNDATQATAGSQPKIVDGGSLVTGGLDFDGVNDGLVVSGQVLTTSTFFMAAVMQHDTGTIGALGETVFGQYMLSTAGRFQLSANNTQAYSFFANATESVSGLSAGAVGTSQTLISTNGDGVNAEIWRNGVSNATDAYSGFTPASLDFTIGIDSSDQREFAGKIAEVIVYDSSQYSNRTAIETNINDHYSIY